MLRIEHQQVPRLGRHHHEVEAGPTVAITPEDAVESAVIQDSAGGHQMVVAHVAIAITCIPRRVDGVQLGIQHFLHTEDVLAVGGENIDVRAVHREVLADIFRQIGRPLPGTVVVDNLTGTRFQGIEMCAAVDQCRTSGDDVSQRVHDQYGSVYGPWRFDLTKSNDPPIVGRSRKAPDQFATRRVQAIDPAVICSEQQHAVVICG